MVFKLTKWAEQRWRTLKGHALLAQVVSGVKFKDGLQEGTQILLPDAPSYTTFAINSLATPADHQSDRVNLRHGTLTDEQDAGLCFAWWHVGNGF